MEKNIKVEHGGQKKDYTEECQLWSFEIAARLKDPNILNDKELETDIKKRTMLDGIPEEFWMYFPKADDGHKDKRDCKHCSQNSGKCPYVQYKAKEKELASGKKQKVISPKCHICYGFEKDIIDVLNNESASAELIQTFYKLVVHYDECKENIDYGYGISECVLKPHIKFLRIGLQTRDMAKEHKKKIQSWEEGFESAVKCMFQKDKSLRILRCLDQDIEKWRTTLRVEDFPEDGMFIEETYNLQNNIKNFIENISSGEIEKIKNKLKEAILV